MHIGVRSARVSQFLNMTLFSALMLILLPIKVLAHGDSIFAPTIAIEEPSVGDELDIVFAQGKNQKEHGGAVHSRGLGMELSKVLFPHFAVSIGTNYQRLRLEDRFASGFDNVEIGAKYEFYINPCQDFLLTMGLMAELGKTGGRSVAESSSIITPTLFLGKGFRNLNDNCACFKPLVMTGIISPNYVTKMGKIDDIDFGLTFQYPIRNLCDEMGWTSYAEFWNYVIPVIELPLSVETTNHCHCKGKVVGTINPGVLFSGHCMQVGVEATLPINKRSGRNVGVLVQLHFFLDNLF